MSPHKFKISMQKSSTISNQCSNMLRTIWILLLAIIITTPLVWLLDHNGSVVINWLDFEVRTDMVTAIIIAAIFTVIIFTLSYLLVRILTFRFPRLAHKKTEI